MQAYLQYVAVEVMLLVVVYHFHLSFLWMMGYFIVHKLVFFLLFTCIYA
jgi:hypothetical protein